ARSPARYRPWWGWRATVGRSGCVDTGLHTSPPPPAADRRTAPPTLAAPRARARWSPGGLRDGGPDAVTPSSLRLLYLRFERDNPGLQVLQLHRFDGRF